MKTQMKEECQRVAMAFTTNCDGSGGSDQSNKMIRLDRAEERRQAVGSEMTGDGGSFIKISPLQKDCSSWF